MVTISLCMIVRDEESVLARCLDSVRDLVDEIIIVDTGSLDDTKAIARRYTENVFDFEWIDDFSAARNFSFERAASDYCLWLDADDVLLQPDRAKFARLKAGLEGDADIVMLPYHVGFDERGNVTFSYYRERIIRSSPACRWKGAVHEVITPAGKVVYGDCAVTHQKLRPSDPDRNLRIFEGLIAKGVSLEPREQFYYGRELYFHRRYAEAEAVLSAFLKSGDGWVENKIDACRQLAYCLYPQGRADEALDVLLHSFSYDLPRAESCCDIGRHFFDREQWQQAAYWYKRALDCPRRDDGGGFVSADAYGFLPCIQLCLCFYHMGDNDAAQRWNALAAGYKPDSPAVRQNMEYFKSLGM